jgi:hypothetical protein
VTGSVGGLALIVLASLTGSAIAAERVAVGALQIQGDISDSGRLRIRQNLSGGLASAGFEVVPDAEVAQAVQKSSGLAGCDTTACLKKLGEVLGVQRVVKANVELIGTARYVINLQLLTVADGQIAAKVEDTCEVCTLVEANDAISNAAAALQSQVAPPRTGPKVETPAIVAGPPPRPTTRQWVMRGVGIGLLALGLGGVIVGIAEAAVNGSRDCTPMAGFTNCPQRIDSTAGIAFGFVTGAVFLAGGAALTYLGWRPVRRAVALVPSVGPQGASVQLTWSF